MKFLLDTHLLLCVPNAASRDLLEFHITRDIKNTKTALQTLPASLCGTFLASI